MNALAVLPSLVDTIEEIRQSSGGPVAIDDIAGIVVSLMTSIQGDLSSTDLQAHQELEELVHYIKNARAEISAIRPNSIRDEEIPTANSELDAIVAATEEATGVFLDVAEQLETMADNMGGEDGEAIHEMTARMYEASNFQDITGQRITKVVSTLSYIEAKVERLSRIIDGQDISDVDAMSMEDLMPPDDRPDADLLHGPAMPEQANNQDDIDALLASFD
ncbi:MAG: protein phosphatase CheZ [Alphaproteobacteria bacterium]|nr:protein phosphatase CheZ [Alphaproteobacteria bacterium]